MNAKQHVLFTTHAAMSNVKSMQINAKLNGNNQIPGMPKNIHVEPRGIPGKPQMSMSGSFAGTDPLSKLSRNASVSMSMKSLGTQQISSSSSHNLLGQSNNYFVGKTNQPAIDFKSAAIRQPNIQMSAKND